MSFLRAENNCFLRALRTVGVYIDYTDDVKSCGKGLETIERKDRVESEKERKRLGGSEK